MKIRCPACEANVPAQDVNLEQLVARCTRCDEVFTVHEQVAAGRRPVPRERPELPRGVRVERGERPLPKDGGYRAGPREDLPGDLLITRRWFQWSALLMLVFCVFWDGFLVVWYYGLPQVEGGGWIFFVVPLAHVAVGLWLTYRTFAMLLNTTRISVVGERLQVRHGPLPWPGGVELPVRAIEQLNLRRTVHRRDRGQQHVSWGVHAETEDHAEVELLTGLRSKEQAAYVEWVIEQHLGIVDQPHRGDS